MTSKLLTPSFAVLTLGAFLAGACTIGTISDEDEDVGGGGQGGESPTTGGTGGTGGTSTGGGGQGGAPEELDCQEDGEVAGTPASTSSSVSDDGCTACQKDKCADEYAACFAQGPGAACQFGATELESTPISGEYFCIESCIWNIEGVGDDEAIENCSALCGSSECNPSAAGSVAVALATCTVVGDGAGDDCYSVCFPGLD